jgi:hypothetical protein
MIANLLTNSDFTGRYRIPLDTGKESAFNDTITEVQYKILIDLMGYPIYKEFETGLAVVPTPEARWTNLRDGVEYTDYCGYLNNWRGLVYMLVPFVWVEWVENENYKVSTLGNLASLTIKNGVGATDYQWKNKLHEIRNEGVKRYNEAFTFMYTNINDYLDFTTFFVDKRFKQIISKSAIR